MDGNLELRLASKIKYACKKLFANTCERGTTCYCDSFVAVFDNLHSMKTFGGSNSHSVLTSLSTQATLAVKGLFWAAGCNPQPCLSTGVWHPKTPGSPTAAHPVWVQSHMWPLVPEIPMALISLGPCEAVQGE